MHDVRGITREFPMKHLISADDREFQRRLEACALTVAEFDHAAHVRLAYVHLCGRDVDAAVRMMKASLLAYLAHLGVSQAKYHETITRAWIMAVDHFMRKSQEPFQSASDFMQANPELLDSRIMLSHYSAELLFSGEARQVFVVPDIQAIPPV